MPGNHGSACASARIATALDSTARLVISRDESEPAADRRAPAARVSSLVAPPSACANVPSVTAICATGGRSRANDGEALREIRVEHWCGRSRGQSCSAALGRACRSPQDRRHGAHCFDLQLARQRQQAWPFDAQDALGAATAEQVERVSVLRVRVAEQIANVGERRALDRAPGPRLQSPRSPPPERSLPFADAIAYDESNRQFPRSRIRRAFDGALDEREMVAPVRARSVRRPRTDAIERDGSTTYASPRRSRPSKAHATRFSIVALRRGSTIASSTSRNGLPSPSRRRSR